MNIGLGIGLTSNSAAGPLYEAGHGTPRNPLAMIVGGHGGPAENATFSAGGRFAAHKNPQVDSYGGLTICAWEGREQDENDWQPSSLLYRASVNGGRNWKQIRSAFRLSSYNGVTGSARLQWIGILNLCIQRIGTHAGRVHLTYFRIDNGSTANPSYAAAASDITVWYMRSDSTPAQFAAGTETWSTPTEITSTVKKANNTTPVGIPAAYVVVGNSNPWGWIAGSNKGIQITRGAYAGRLVFTADHRYTTDTSGNSWFHTMKSDDEGDTWALGGGLDENVAGNANANETCIAECADGSLIASIRLVGGTTYKRALSYSLDGGGTWSNMVVQDGTGGTPNMVSRSTNASMCSTPAGDVIHQFMADASTDLTTDRKLIDIWRATGASANALTWTRKRSLVRTISDYQDVTALDSQNFLSVVGVTQDYDTAPNGTLSNFQYIKPIRWNRVWLENESIYPEQYRYEFNEDTAGTATSTSGSQIFSRTEYDQRWKGGAGASFVSGGISLSGAAAGCIAQQFQNTIVGGPLDPSNKDYTLEIKDLNVSTDQSAAGYIFDNCNGTGAGMYLRVNASTHKLTWRYSDGTNTGTVTSTNAVNDGVTIGKVRCERDTTTHKARLFLDDVEQGTAGGTAETAGNTGTVIGTQDLLFGSRADGTLPCKFTCTSVLITRAVKTGGYLPNAPTTKLTPAQFTGYTPTAPAWTPLSLSNLTLWIAGTYHGSNGYGAFGGTDPYGGFGPLHPVMDGSGIGSFRCLKTGRKFIFNSTSYLGGGYWYRDTHAGWMVRHGYYSNTSNEAWHLPSPSTNYDYFQNNLASTGFTYAGIFKFHADTSQLQTLLDTRQNTSSNSGISFWLDNSNAKLRLAITGTTSATRFAETILGAAPALSYGTTYFIGITGPVSTNKVALFLGPYSNGAAPTLTKYTSTATISGTDGTWSASARPLRIGIRSDGGAHAANMSTKNIISRDVVTSDADMQLLCDFGASDPGAFQ